MKNTELTTPNASKQAGCLRCQGGSRFVVKVTLICLLGTLTITPTLADSNIDTDGVLHVDGQRRFPLGLYQHVEDADFGKELSAAGFNLMRCGANRDQLDRVAAHGMGAWVALGHTMLVRQAPDAVALKRTVDGHKAHPALWVWEAPDEILWTVYYNKLQTVDFQRWLKLDKLVEEKAAAGDADKLLDLHAKHKTYRDSARWAQAEEYERRIRPLLDLPADAGPRLSDWHAGVEPTLSALAGGARVIRENDGAHPIWLNFAPRNTLDDLRRFGAVGDVIGCDIYPVPFDERLTHSDLADRNLSSTGVYTRRMLEAGDGRPAWMVLQGFGWADLDKNSWNAEVFVRPTYEQMRYTACDAIANGTRGLLWFGTSFVIETKAPFWQDLKRLVRELADIEDLLAAPDAGLDLRMVYDPTAQSMDRDIVVCARRIADRYVLVLANENNRRLAFRIDGLAALNGKQLDVRGSWETLAVEDGSVRFGLPGMGCAILITKQ